MGFSSLEAKPIVDFAISNNLIGHGAGNIVYRVAKAESLSVREAGVKLSQGQLWDMAATLFRGGADNV